MRSVVHRNVVMRRIPVPQNQCILCRSRVVGKRRSFSTDTGRTRKYTHLTESRVECNQVWWNGMQNTRLPAVNSGNVDGASRRTVVWQRYRRFLSPPSLICYGYVTPIEVNLDNARHRHCRIVSQCQGCLGLLLQLSWDQVSVTPCSPDG